MRTDYGKILYPDGASINTIGDINRLWNQDIVTVAFRDQVELTPVVIDWLTFFNEQDLRFKFEILTTNEQSWNDADIRIDFIAERGGASYLGNDALKIDTDKDGYDKGWTCNIGFEEYRDGDSSDFRKARVAPHEATGHAIGFLHQQMNPLFRFNRPAYKVWRMSQGWTAEQVQTFFDQKDAISKSQGYRWAALNPYSMMQYPYPVDVLPEDLSEFGYLPEDKYKINYGDHDSLIDEWKWLYGTVEDKHDQVCIDQFDVAQIRKAMQTFDNVLKSKI